MSLKGKVALVTGASRGLGQAIAIALGKHEATVVGTATSDSGAQAITEAFKQANIAGMGLQLDVKNNFNIEEAIKKISSNFSEPLIVVNNAGITRDNLLLRMKEEEWDDIIATNLTSVYKVTKACLRAMIKARWGRIINISSVVGSSGNPGQANYAAAKAGIIGFSKSLAQEIGARGITVNVVAPGFIDTDMTRRLQDSQKELLLSRIPLGHLGDPIDIAHAVLFLASEQARYITGHTLHVNGGMYMA